MPRRDLRDRHVLALCRGMNRLRWIVLVPLALCCGCFRAASVHPSDLQQLSVDQGSAAIVYKNGDSRRIAHFDSITVQTNAPPLGATPGDPACTRPEFQFEFDRTTRGSLSAPLLRLEDQHSRRVFSLAQVQNITLESYSPARPWLILAAAGIGAVAGGVLGYAMGHPCDREWGCMEKALYAMAAAPIGFGVGLALGFPLTRNLGDFQRAPAGPSASTAHEP